MKGYVLVDMPESCGPVCEIYESCRQRFKPCPIKPLPEWKHPSVNPIETIFNNGWNSCLDEIRERRNNHG